MQVNRRPKLELFLLSAVSLFLELLIIRWLGADIRAFAVFQTFPLIVCFIGLGVGCALNDDKWFKHAPFIVFLFLLIMKLADIAGIGFWGFPSLSVFQWQNLVGLHPNTLYVFVFLVLMLFVLSVPFALCVSIGARLGVLFNELPPLSAYGWNILGALTGSILFPVASYFCIPPWVLGLVAGLVLGAEAKLLTRYKSVLPSAILIFAVPLFLCLPSESAKPLMPDLVALVKEPTVTYWSPYQRLDLTVFHAPPDVPVKSNNTNVQLPFPFLGLELGVNRAFYQWFFNENADPTKSKLDRFLTPLFRAYAMAFSFNSPKTALIVGAGTGQNVSSALRAGVRDIDAVDIDPIILQLGKRYNRDNLDSRVHLICDDARHYFQVCKKKYDVIAFSALDSQAVTGLGSSVRIDTYVYTKESFEKAQSLLNPGGLLTVWFATTAPHTKDRLFETLKAATGAKPIMISMMGTTFLAGESVRNGTLRIPALYEGLIDRQEPTKPGRFLTDDWPYLYVRPDVFDWPYWLVVAEILAVGAFASRNFFFREAGSVYWQLFLLGAAFMLLELHAISFLALLYGATWVTSAIVINGILAMIYLANMAVMLWKVESTGRRVFIYAMLIGSILLSYFLPATSVMASLPVALAYALITLITLAPMGVAAINFSSTFRNVDTPARGLAFNLCGAVIGGLLEYASNYTGLKALELIAALLYAAAFFLMMRKR